MQIVMSDMSISYFRQFTCDFIGLMLNFINCEGIVKEILIFFILELFSLPIDHNEEVSYIQLCTFETCTF